MSISSSTEKYFTKVFPYSTLTAAPGKPTYAAINQTQSKIFECASSIASLHGGGQLGELGLFITPSAYDLVTPANTYIPPVHPGNPPTFDGMTQRKIHANEGQYIARVSDFKNINQIKQKLTNLLISAYGRKWLAVIMDSITGQINKQLPLIFYLLYTNDGQITQTALNQKRDACTNIVYNTSKPIDEIWVQITSYSLMAQAEKSPATNEQLINIGIIILKCRSFYPRYPQMAQTPRARTQLANVPRTLQQVPNGARTCIIHSQLYGFPQSKRQQRGRNRKQTLRQDISQHHRTCHLLRKVRGRSIHSNEPTNAAATPGNTTKYPHATSTPKPYLPSNQLVESI